MAVRNSLLVKFSGKFRCCWKFTDFPAARNVIPAKVWALSGKESGCWKIGRAFGNVLDFLLRDRHSLLEFFREKHVGGNIQRIFLEDICASKKKVAPTSFCILATLRNHPAAQEQKSAIKESILPKTDLKSGSQKRGVEFKGVAFMTVLVVLTGLAVLENTLHSFCWSYKIQDKEATVTVLTVLAVSVVTATPLKLNPSFSVILIKSWKFEKVVAVSGVCSGVPKENSGKVPGNC